MYHKTFGNMIHPNLHTVHVVKRILPTAIIIIFVKLKSVLEEKKFCYLKIIRTVLTEVGSKREDQILKLLKYLNRF